MWIIFGGRRTLGAQAWKHFQLTKRSDVIRLDFTLSFSDITLFAGELTPSQAWPQNWPQKAGANALKYWNKPDRRRAVLENFLNNIICVQWWCVYKILIILRQYARKMQQQQSQQWHCGLQTFSFFVERTITAWRWWLYEWLRNANQRLHIQGAPIKTIP